MATDFLQLDTSEGLEASASEKVRRLAHFEERVDKFMEFMTFSREKRAYLIKEYGAESTSDFPLLFGTVLDRTLYAMYRNKVLSWRQYIRVGTQRDFRANNILGLFGLQTGLPLVPELAEYPVGKVKEGKLQNQVHKYGRVFPLSWEVLVNDDLNAFSTVAERMAESARQTEYLAVTNLMVASTGPSTTLFGNAVAAFDGGTIDNYDTQPLSAGTLFDTITALSNQRDFEGLPIMVDGYVLVVPPAKYKAALEAVSPAALIATGVGNAAARQTSANVTANLNIEILQNPYLPVIDTTTGSTAWYVFANPSNGAAIQMNFLAGHETPEIVMKASDKMALGGGSVSPLEGDFLQDSMQWRVRHILGGTVVDPRFAYAQAATT